MQRNDLSCQRAPLLRDDPITTRLPSLRDSRAINPRFSIFFTVYVVLAPVSRMRSLSSPSGVGPP